MGKESLISLVKRARDLKMNVSGKGDFDRLLAKRVELEKEIHDAMFAGAHLDARKGIRVKRGMKVCPEIIEYCFVNFPAVVENVNGENNYSESAFSYVPRVLQFMSSVGSFVNKQFLQAANGVPYLTGRILDSPRVDVKQMGEYHHRQLNIPVSGVFSYNPSKEAWERMMDITLISVDKRILKNDLKAPPLFLRRMPDGGRKVESVTCWEGRDPEGTFYVGGRGPGVSQLYLGDNSVNAALGNYEREKRLAKIK